jgi:HSP20 family molecular chaperone IbpA
MADDVERRDRVAQATQTAEESMRPQTVPVNVYETQGAVVVIAPLPAVQAEDVAIDLQSGRLRITAALRSAPPRTYLVHEWEYGGYDREVEVPEGYGAGVEASLANGQLAIRVLKGEPTGRVTISPGAH